MHGNQFPDSEETASQPHQLPCGLLQVQQHLLHLHQFKHLCLLILSTRIVTLLAMPLAQVDFLHELVWEKRNDAKQIYVVIAWSSGRW
jgi:hypothetical protein